MNFEGLNYLYRFIGMCKEKITSLESVIQVQQCSGNTIMNLDSAVRCLHMYVS